MELNWGGTCKIRCPAMGKGRGAAACLLQTLLLPLCLAEEGPQTENVGAVQCLNNYGDQPLSWLNCTWRPNRLPGPGPFYLHFNDPEFPQYNLACRLPVPLEAPGESSCSMSTEEEFTPMSVYHVSLHDASSGKNVSHTVIPTYKPSLHIRCDPPTDLQSNMSASKCRLQWKRPAALDLIDSFQWQLAFKATTAPWEATEAKTRSLIFVPPLRMEQAQHRSFSSREPGVELEGSEFEPGVNYLARLRCRIAEHDVDYGRPPSWPPAVPPSWALLVSLPLCLGALLFLLLGLQVFSRNKGDGYGCIRTPTPAKFFQPLYASHNGNFQHWVGLQEAGSWRRTSHSSPSGKGGGTAAVGCQPLEAISPVSILQQQSEAKALSQERVLLPLPAASDWPYVGSKYVVLEGGEQGLPAGHEAEAQPLFSGGGSLQPQGPGAVAQPGCPYMLCHGAGSPQQTPCLEKEPLPPCSEDYCTLDAGGSSSSSVSRAEGGWARAAQIPTGQA